MTEHYTGSEHGVELVSDIDEGRMAYIAAMAAELSRMAAISGEVGLADRLKEAAHEAARARKNRMRK